MNGFITGIRKTLRAGSDDPPKPETKVTVMKKDEQGPIWELKQEEGVDAHTLERRGGLVLHTNKLADAAETDDVEWSVLSPREHFRKEIMATVKGAIEKADEQFPLEEEK